MATLWNTAGHCIFALWLWPLCNSGGHYIFVPWFLPSVFFLFSSPNLSRRR